MLAASGWPEEQERGAGRGVRPRKTQENLSSDPSSRPGWASSWKHFGADFAPNVPDLGTLDTSAPEFRFKCLRNIQLFREMGARRAELSGCRAVGARPSRQHDWSDFSRWFEQFLLILH